MEKLIAIGEALVDFIPQDKTKALKDITKFSPKVGGAPLNVLGAYQRLGGKGKLLTVIGADAFGTKILNYLNKYGIDTSGIHVTNKLTTPLAFVSYKANDREFFFTSLKTPYSLYRSSYLKAKDFLNTYALHFCTVALKEGTMVAATKAAIALAKEHGALISFDLNLRFQIYNDDELLKKRVQEFLPFANILKISDDEFAFLYPNQDPLVILPNLLSEDLKLILYTAGKDGCVAIMKDFIIKEEGFVVNNIVDTTGAGDGFIGSFLFQLSQAKLKNLSALTKEDLAKYLKFSNAFCALSITKKGAISSYPRLNQVKDLLEQ